MGTPPVSTEISVKRKALIERLLCEGYSPIGVSGGRGSAACAAARELGIHIPTLNSWIRSQIGLKKNGKPNYLPDWTLWNRGVSRVRGVATVRPTARRWLLTAAQNDTKVHDGFWANLNAYANHLGAQVLVGPFTYQLGVFTDHTTRNNEFAEAVREFLRFDRLECGDVLFCAEMNTLPTAVRPLSGLHAYTRGHWGVFPHAKIALETVPAMPGSPPPIIMTTGACTVENYIAKKAGIKASFHHVIGATLVEADAQGRHFCRQINAIEDGSFQDLDRVVAKGRVAAGKRVAAINWGDIHSAKLDPQVATAAWGIEPAGMMPVPTAPASMIDELRPFDQFFHDLFDGESINHWQADKPHERYELHAEGKLDVQSEVAHARAFLRASQRPWCRSHIVESNHDLWISRWLQKIESARDLLNVEAYHRWNLAAFEAGRRQDHDFSIFRHVLREADGSALEDIDFIPEGTSVLICKDRGGGIECGAHGHRGPNGTRGTTANLSRMGTKINKGHDHTAAIMDGAYSAGVCGPNRRLMKGPGTHTASNIITYPNGKRTIITMQGGAWRA